MSHQAIQATHSAIEYALKFGPLAEHPTFIHVQVNDKIELEDLCQVLVRANINISIFSEPFQQWGLTSISCLLTSEERYLLKHLPLWAIKTS